MRKPCYLCKIITSSKRPSYLYDPLPPLQRSNQNPEGFRLHPFNPLKVGIALIKHWFNLQETP